MKKEHKKSPEGHVIEQPVTRALEVNYMPYAMSVIVSRAIPEIDGFKPSHRKLLYTMYKMGLLNGGRTKSANVVGQTMRLNPHGEGAIYETMVRLARGYEALLHPFVDSKGNFGKVYSRDMAYAASRYTEVKLDVICSELFGDIDSDTVDFVDNYDNTMKEPLLLPCSFPNVLVSANQGIAVGMASQICGFNLGEVCRATIAYIDDPQTDLLENMPAPDFPTGGELLYDAAVMREIYNTGRGSFRVRAKWRYDKKEHLIEVTEIPYTTTIEAIMDKTAELIKAGKIKDIADMRDETDLSGLKLTIEPKRGADPEALMSRLFRQTTLMDSFSCNFNILVGGSPQVLGVSGILEEWVAWRAECVRRRLCCDVNKLRRKLHLLRGLEKILLDIDKAIAIIRGTESEDEVVPNLMIGFRIDETQAEYVAEIRLRNINQEYILKRTREIESINAEIDSLEQILNSKARLRGLIKTELKRVAAKYSAPRKTVLIEEYEAVAAIEPEPAEDYPVHVFVSREGYFKKISPQSLRMSGEQKWKEDDGLSQSFQASNRDELIVLTNKQQAYKAALSDFEDTKASALGDYLPSKLSMESDERALFVILPGDYKGWLLIAFENGKVARIELSAYDTKSNRRRLTGAYSDKSAAVAFYHLTEERELMLRSTEGRGLIFHSASLTPKTTRSTQGVAVMTLKGRHKLAAMEEPGERPDAARYRVRSLPSIGALIRGTNEQLKL